MVGCSDVITGSSQRCSDHCRNSLIALTSTEEGEALMKVREARSKIFFLLLVLPKKKKKHNHNNNNKREEEDFPVLVPKLYVVVVRASVY